MLLIGSHVSFKNDSQLYGSTKEALSYGENCFMFYTGAPQNTIRASIDDAKTMEAYMLMKENNINLENIIVHAPYIVNLANNIDIDKYNFAKNFLRNEIERCELLGIKYMVLHPGSATKLDRTYALNNIINALNDILITSNVIILLETMAGKGTELGITIDELKYIIDHIENKEHIGVCLDTCHLSDSGVDLTKFDEYISEFDKSIGIDKIKCIHINDSKNIIGSKKDRHENIGYGTIGFNTLLNIIYDERFESIPKILETPYVDKIYQPFKEEIKMIKNKEFNPNLIDDIIKCNMR